MRELSTLAFALGFLVLIGAAVFVFDDRQTLVSPPEAVGEQFVRQLAGHRAEQARHQLSDRARKVYSVRRLEAWFRDVRGAVGDVENVEGRSETCGLDEAAATVVVDGPERRASLPMLFVRERGEWRVDRL